MTDTPSLADRLSIEHQHTSPGGQLRNCTCPLCPDLRAAATELRELNAWKESAMNVMAEWDEVFDALGRPGKLGASKAASSLAEVERLKATVPVVDDATRQEVENPSEPVAHRVVLEQFDGGWPYWRLDCLHGATDERWHVYCGECTDSDCGHRTHHDVCIVRPWWDEEGVELVADTTGPLNVPFGVDVEWDGDVPRLIPRIAKD